MKIRTSNTAVRGWQKADNILPEYETDCIVIYKNGKVSCNHRTNNPNVTTDDRGWCRYDDKQPKVEYWIEQPRLF